MTRTVCSLSLALAAVSLTLALPSSTAVARGLDLPAVREVTIPAGTRLRVRLNAPVSSSRSRVEDAIDATLTAPLLIKGIDVLPAGSHLKGFVSSVQRSGKVKGRASFVVSFRTLTVGADAYPIAARLSRLAPATKGEDAAKIGIPAVGGAIIGALAGGKKGAAGGAAIGGGAGTAVVLSTRGRDVGLARGAVVSLTLQKPVVIKVTGK